MLPNWKWFIPAVVLFTMFFYIMAGMFILSVAHADEINVEKLADAIYLAEGGVKTKHPYGILAKYKHTSPRQACINTINHRLQLWKGGTARDFIAFLSKTYAPINATNDPAGLNQNWVKNTVFYYEKE